MDLKKDEQTFYISCSENFILKFKNGKLISLCHPEDKGNTEFIENMRCLGDILIDYRIDEEVEIKNLVTTKTCYFRVEEYKEKNKIYYAEWGDNNLKVAVRWKLLNRCLMFAIYITNLSRRLITIENLAVSCNSNSFSVKWEENPDKKVMRHCLISGYNSYFYWTRFDGTPPYLMMVPAGKSRFEYFKEERQEDYPFSWIYILANLEHNIARQKGCQWRQPITNLKLKPGETVVYPFKFMWAQSYEEIRKNLYEEKLLDITVIPGMTVPKDIEVYLYIKTKLKIWNVEAEYSNFTLIEEIERKMDNVVYKIRFNRTGENFLKIWYGDNKYCILEFFVTEPLEVLIKKRAAFIKKCQYKNPSKWFDGLFCEWNMETKTLLTPENPDRIKGWRIYAITCDDPGLSKPSYMAAKNLEYPEDSEIEALEYYIERFVWGGLQRTDKEEYAYGIYGIPDWKTNRESLRNGKEGKFHIWRIYDYPHLVRIYWNMYKICRMYPWIKTKLKDFDYLMRAYYTAIGMFTIPNELTEWSAYKTGLYNEKVIPEIIEELKKVGENEKAYRLQLHWERKVFTMIKSDFSNIYRSEYPFDTTAFESTHAIAKYALERVDKEGIYSTVEGKKIGVDEIFKFMQRQIKANIACRGYLEPAYYWFGSDYRGCGNWSYTLSYMSQMGGWSILDYGIWFADDPSEYIRLGYAAFLSSWALMNSGEKENNYGYWYPGPENDGAAAGGFEPLPYGITWLDQPHHRGAWYYSCEIDLGYSAAVSYACTIITYDLKLGFVCYGGNITKDKSSITIIPKDGVRRRIIVIFPSKRILLESNGARFRTITLKSGLSEKLCFECEIESAFTKKNMQKWIYIQTNKEISFEICIGLQKTKLEKIYQVEVPLEYFEENLMVTFREI